MEESLQLTKEVHVIAEELKGTFEGSEEKKESGEPSSKKKENVESGKKIWKKAPLVQIDVTFLEIGDFKRVFVILDTSLFGFQETAIDPLVFFEIIDGTLVKTSDFREELNQRKAKNLAPIQWDPRPATITSASTHAWNRTWLRQATPNCDCDPSYSQEGRDHSQPSMCKEWGIGGAIANRLWDNEPIEGMTFEKKLLV